MLGQETLYGQAPGRRESSLPLTFTNAGPMNTASPIAETSDAETPRVETPPAQTQAAQTQAAAAPGVLAGVDLSQPLRAIGTEPFWSVEIRPDGLVYGGVDRPETKIANPGAVVHGEKAIIAAKDASGAGLTIALHTAQCSDGMSDRVYRLEVEIAYMHETLKGCADSQPAIDSPPRP